MASLWKLLLYKLALRAHRRTINCGRLTEKAKDQFYTRLITTKTGQPPAKVPIARCSSGTTPKGYLPIYVGDQKIRCMIKAKHLNHPRIVELLERSAQEYGYPESGALRVLCDAESFESIFA